MKRKLPDDAFEYYFGLGMERSYQAVATNYGVAKKTVSARAKHSHQSRSQVSIAVHGADPRRGRPIIPEAVPARPG